MCSTEQRPNRWILPALAMVLLFGTPPARSAGQNKIVYDSFDWYVYTSTHFDVHYYSREKDTLQKVVSMAESAYDELSRRLNYQIPKRIPLIYYTTHAEFEQNNVILNFIPEGVGAFAEPARNRMVLPIDVPDEKLQALIQHELTHVFEYEVLFGGRLSRVLTSNAPTWFMEGLASYFGNDEDDKDRMYVRDAVNSDLIPPITKVQIEGYPAYRYGHAVFDFIEAEWGKDAVRDFVYEYRSFLGRDVAVALRRAFDVQPDQFDLKFRRYLRKKYLPLLAVKGEATEYGEQFRVGPYQRPSYEIGAAPSPSGDFVATLTTYKDDIDIALLSVKDRKLYKNLSAGKTTRYEYIVGQYLTAAPASGRDLSFAPDGDRISVSPDVPLSPSWSPDGQSIVFAGTDNSIRDIFLLDLKTKTVRNLSNDGAYDEAPVFSKDGKSIYHSKLVGGLSKIVRFPLEDPSKVEQVTWGDGNDEDPAISPDGKRLYFSSSRGGIYNVYSQDLASGEIWQYSDVIGAAIGPAPFIGPDGLEKVVFTGFQALRFQLYVADAKKPFRKLDEKALPPAPVKTGGVADFVPAVEVSIDPEKKSRPRFKLFLENAGVQAGINSDQTFVSQVRLDFSDMLGNTRAFFQFDSVSSFSNFQIGIFNLAHRFQYGLQVFDNRSYYLTQDINTGDISTRRINKVTGASIDGIYPLSRYFRLEASVGFLARSLDLPLYGNDGSILYTPRSDNVATLGVGLSYDTTRYKDFGPAGGHRVDVSFSYLPQFKKQEGDTGSTLSRDVTVELRQYLPISRRTLFAIRGFGGMSDGNAPNIFVFGGLDTLRGFDYASFYGNRAFYVNAEFRFPLIDLLATPVLAFGGVRGHVFLDVGGAWLKGQPFQFWDDTTSRLKDARSAYGAGFSIWFLGLPWNVDFAQLWDFHSKIPGGFQTTFFVGQTF